jgi:hypothetical protein
MLESKKALPSPPIVNFRSPEGRKFLDGDWVFNQFPNPIPAAFWVFLGQNNDPDSAVDLVQAFFRHFDLAVNDRRLKLHCIHGTLRKLFSSQTYIPNFLPFLPKVNPVMFEEGCEAIRKTRKNSFDGTPHRSLSTRSLKYWRCRMQVYTYSEARQKLASVLEQAEATGKVLIRRKDGRTYALTPEKVARSPLDVPSIKAEITSQEIVDIVRAGRERP